MQTAEERKAHAVKLSRAWYASPAGQAYQLVLRERLFHPEWKLLPGLANGSSPKTFPF